MEDGPTYGFDTLQIHAGSRPDPVTGARQPQFISQQLMFFAMLNMRQLYSISQEGLYIPRLTNPTVSVLQERIATLEGGVGAVCCSSGHAAAQIMALFPLMTPGCNVIASTRLYGGTVTNSAKPLSVWLVSKVCRF